jgi:hypothetical protein
MTNVIGAYATLARGDTSLAIRRFSALRPTAEHAEVEGSLWESLAVERLRLAGLLLATGDAEGAHRIASTFDHPGILVHGLFLRPSIDLRVRAARAFGDPARGQGRRAGIRRPCPRAARRRTIARARSVGLAVLTRQLLFHLTPGGNVEAKKPGKPAPAGAAAAKAGEPGKKHECNLPEICAYLKLVSDHLKKLDADYKKVRFALCQLEKQVYDGTPHQHNVRFCKGSGTGNEPADPPPPPEW